MALDGAGEVWCGSEMRCAVGSVLLMVVCGCAGLDRADPVNAALRWRDGEAVASGARGTVRIATYNVHGQSAEALAGAIRRSPQLARAEVLFLQEIEIDGEDTPGRLAELLGMSYVYAPGYGIGRDGSHGVAILSRMALRDPKLVELPRYDVGFNSARRVALAATIDLDGRPLRLYSVHLDNRLNPADRAAQLEPVLDDVVESPGDLPVVIAGDMNTSPFCWIGNVVPVPCGMQDNRLEAAVRAGGLDTPVVTSGATSKWLTMRLDAIYTRHLRTSNFGVSKAVRVSDHLPLWADVRLAARTSG